MFTLHNGDCLQVMPSIPSGSIDAIITDLPYGTTACAWDEVIPLADMWREVKRVLKQNGAFITTSAQPFTSILIASNLDMFKYDVIWNKGHTGMFAVSNYRLLPVHETIAVFGNGTITYNPQMKKGKPYIEKPRKNERENNHKLGTKSQLVVNNGTRFPTTIIDINSQSAECNNTTRFHPTQKPLDLYRYLIRTYTNEGETILDFCMGSGTTIEAAEIEGRNSIGIEKEIGYFQIAEKRAKSAVLQQRLFTPSNNRLHMDAGDSPRQPSQSTLEGFTPAEQGTTPAPRQ